MYHRDSKVWIIVDSPTLALLSSLLPEDLLDGAIVIVESKLSIDDGIQLDSFINHMLPVFHDLAIETVEVPSHYSSFRKSLFNKFIAKRSLRSKALLSLKNKGINIVKNDIVIGPRTSLLMNSLTHANRMYIDHGFAEYGRRARYYDLSAILKILTNFIVSFKHLILRLFGIPFAKPAYSTSFTACKLDKDTCHHLDFMHMNLSNEFIQELFHLKSVLLTTNPTLVCLDGDMHTGDSGPIYNKIYDNINFDLILRHCSTSETLILKYHPSLYLNGQRPISCLEALLNKNGFKTFNVDQILPSFLAGLLPAEVLIRELAINKIVSSGTAVSFNSSHIDAIVSVLDFNTNSPNAQLFLTYSKLSNLINNHLTNKLCICIDQ
jgi:hypothetical protein